MTWHPRGRFVPKSTIERRMAAKDARIHREYRRQLEKAKVLYDAVGEGDKVGGTANGDQTVTAAPDRNGQALTEGAHRVTAIPHSTASRSWSIPEGTLHGSGSAWLYADWAHQGQLDKAGRPYIEHLSRVADAVKKLNLEPDSFQPEAEVVAWLHDVLEDFPELLDDVKGRVTSNVFGTLLLVNSRGQSRFNYIRTLAQSGNRIAIAVKLADLLDHLRFGASDVLPEAKVNQYLDEIRVLHAHCRLNSEAVRS